MPTRAAILIALIAALALPSSAVADGTADVSIMDDQLLLNEDQEGVDRDMRTFRALGIDRVRVSAFWSQIAPASSSRTKPAGFDGANDQDPRYAWAPLDRVVASANQYGLGVMVSISMPAPIWATGATKVPNPLWKPSVSEFADFSQAVATRYADLVDRYGISNEPNGFNWLQPQSDRKGLYAPHHYRNMVLASYPRIKAADPGSLVLVGELASTGVRGRGAKKNIRPLTFLREMACRTSKYRRKRSGRCANFKPIPADAIGHHPYQLLTSPFLRSPNRDDAAINDSRRLLRVIDKLTRQRAIAPQGGRRRLNLYFTEYGYQTNPPDPFAGVSLGTQRRYIQQAAYVAWRSPRVKEINQFRLTDGGIGGTGARRFAEFQSGLLFRNRRPKPAYAIFANPFVITGSRFWGQVRPGGDHAIRIERKATRRGRYRLFSTALTNSRGYFAFRLRGRPPGYYRYSWGSPKRYSGTIRLKR